MSCLSTYDFSTLYTTLRHNRIKDKRGLLTERIVHREGSLYSIPLMQPEIIIYCLARMWCEALTYLLDNIYIRFGSKLYRQIVDMFTSSVPLVADLFLFCYERLPAISFK